MKDWCIYCTMRCKLWQQSLVLFYMNYAWFISLCDLIMFVWFDFILNIWIRYMLVGWNILCLWIVDGRSKCSRKNEKTASSFPTAPDGLHAKNFRRLAMTKFQRLTTSTMIVHVSSDGWPSVAIGNAATDVVGSRRNFCSATDFFAAANPDSFQWPPMVWNCQKLPYFL